MNRKRTIKDKGTGNFGPSGYLDRSRFSSQNVHSTATLPSATCVRDRIGVNYSADRFEGVD